MKYFIISLTLAVAAASIVAGHIHDRQLAKKMEEMNAYTDAADALVRSQEIINDEWALSKDLAFERPTCTCPCEDVADL